MNLNFIEKIENKTNIIITNKDKLNKKIEKIKLDEFSNLHFLSDFDRTLIKAFTKSKEFVPSLISILRSENFVSSEFVDESKKIFEYYHKIEIDNSLSFNYKYKKMEEWWEKSADLQIKHRLNLDDIKKLSKSKKIIFRKYLKEILEFTNDRKIPFIILSASGIGYESIYYTLVEHKINYSNIDIISNELIFDKEGYHIKTKKPMVHIFNKNETAIKDNFKIYDKIKSKKNIILLGDSIGDSYMADGFNYEEIIKIGFLNSEVEENINYYKEHFDIVITNDSDLQFLYELLNFIK